MLRVRSDIERLMKEKERILKILSDKKNQGVIQPNPERDTQVENERQVKDQNNDRLEISHSQRTKKNINYDEVSLVTCQNSKK